MDTLEQNEFNINTSQTETPILTYIKYGIIILIVVVLGFYLLKYLAKNTNTGRRIQNSFEKLGIGLYREERKIKKQFKKIKKQEKKEIKKAKSNIKELEKAINFNVKHATHNRKKLQNDSSYSSTIQKRGKHGFCYVGNDRGFRSCVEIDKHDQCESNKVFPSKELCINPSLRG
tara:strand:- start:52 stop:573 length:522 start_codon:yes stop_codon:yes gene_type:complete